MISDVSSSLNILYFYFVDRYDTHQRRGETPLKFKGLDKQLCLCEGICKRSVVQMYFLIHLQIAHLRSSKDCLPSVT